MVDLTTFANTVDPSSVLSSALGVSAATLAIIIAVVLVWNAVWKGIALWKSARNSHLVWFLIFLLVNLLAIPEIIYIAFFSNPRKNKAQAETKSAKAKKR